MTAPVYPLAPAFLPLQQATQKLWMIRHLLQSGDIDLPAAVISLGVLCQHPNPRIAALALATSCDIADCLEDADAKALAQ